MELSLTQLFLRFCVNYGAEWVMWLLVALSGVSFYLIIERTIFFIRHRTDAAGLSGEMSKRLVKNDLKGLAKRLGDEKGVVARILEAGVNQAKLGHLAAEQAIGGERTRQKLRCERNLAVLATIGNNAPFIGLFGTVIGVLVAFNSFSSDTTSGAQAVMEDISEALAATAIGIFVAIPAVAAFNTFQRRTKGTLAVAESLSSLLLTHLRGKAAENEGSDAKGSKES